MLKYLICKQPIRPNSIHFYFCRKHNQQGQPTSPASDAMTPKQNGVPLKCNITLKIFKVLFAAARHMLYVMSLWHHQTQYYLGSGIQCSITYS